MRKRYVLAGAFALALTASSAVALGDNLRSGNDLSTHDVSANSHTVTLPSGDQVTLSPDGRIHIDSVADRSQTSFFYPIASDGSDDVIVIPTDRAKSITAGEEDPALYNVSALLRAGHTDARDIDVSDLDGKTYGQFAPINETSTRSTDNAVDVEFAITDPAGNIPETAQLSYTSLVDGEMGDVEVNEDGTGTAELPIGDYEFVLWANAESGDVLGGTQSVTVDEDTAEVKFDGAEAFLVESSIDDADVDMLMTSAEYGYEVPGDAMSRHLVVEVLAGSDLYMLPMAAGEAGETERFMNYFPSHTEDVDDPAAGPNYHLAFEATDGISEDLSFSVDVDELTEVTSHYGSLGVDQPAIVNTCAVSERTMILVCPSIEVELPSKRVDYLTASDRFTWSDEAIIGSDPSAAVIVRDDIGTVKPGPMERDMIHTPLSLSLQNGDVVWENGNLLVSFWVLDNGLTNEIIMTDAVTASMTLERDGEVLGSVDDAHGEFTVSDGDSGRYVLSIDAETDLDTTPLATQTSGTWEFDAVPQEEFDFLDLSSIEFDAEGVVNGYAPADESLDFTMNYAPQHDELGSDLEDLEVEVSYDDGETWTSVEVEVDGNEINGFLEHEDGAEYVSVRTEATDADGNVVTQETIRSFGLQ